MLKSATTKAIANNTAFQLIGKVVSMSVTILATVIITRRYGPDGYGAFNLMQNIPALFFIIADFGINAVAARELARDFTKAEKYFGNVLALRVLLSLILMLVVLGAAVFLPYSPELKFGLHLATFLILTQALYATTNIIFQVKLRYDLSTIGYILGSFVILALVLLFSYFNVSIAWVNFSYVIGGFVTFFVNLAFIRKYLNLRIKIDFDPKILKYLLWQSLPLGLMFIFSQINFKADSIMLSFLPVPENLQLSNQEVVGVYGLPYKIFEVALVVPTFFMNAVYPIYVRHLQESKEKLKDTFLKTILALALFGGVGAIVGIIFSPFVIKVLGGEEFVASVPALRLLIVGLPIFYVTQPLSWLIVTLNKQKFLPGVYLVGAIVNLTANFMLIPIYSFYASAALTWICELIILLLLAYFAYKSWKGFTESADA